MTRRSLPRAAGPLFLIAGVGLWCCGGDPSPQSRPAEAASSARRSAPSTPEASSGGTEASRDTPSTFALNADWGKALKQVERRVLDLTNQERRRRRLTALKDEGTLTRLARQHSSDMLRRGFFAHDNPDGESVADRVAAGHRRLVGLPGENIWSGSGYSVDDAETLARTIVDGWMSSPGHRENILRPSYTHLGVGVVLEGREIRATQNFATVLAYLRQALPPALRRGDEPDLSLDVLDTNRAPPELFVLWSPRRRRDVTEPIPVQAPRLEAPGGTYWLRFYFPEDAAGRYELVFGPSFELR